jgi:zinc transporter, ZIP family
VGDALFWGVVAASSLVFGMVLGLARAWPERLIGLVLAFGAGALVSGVSFELFEQGVAVGGAASVGVGLAAGALVYFLLARAVERIGSNRSQAASSGGTALALGAFLDGIPEQISWRRKPAGTSRQPSTASPPGHCSSCSSTR